MSDGEDRRESPPAAKRRKKSHQDTAVPTPRPARPIAEQLRLVFHNRYEDQVFNHLAVLLEQNSSMTKEDGIDMFADLVAHVATQLEAALKTHPSDMDSTGDAPMLATVLERCSRQLQRFAPLASAFQQDSSLRTLRHWQTMVEGMPMLMPALLELLARELVPRQLLGQVHHGRTQLEAMTAQLRALDEAIAGAETSAALELLQRFEAGHLQVGWAFRMLALTQEPLWQQPHVGLLKSLAAARQNKRTVG